MLNPMPGLPLQPYEIRPAGPEDAAALFILHAAIAEADAGQLLGWTQIMEERLETGGRAWVIGRGRQLAGYAAADPVPGLAGVYDLSGGIVPAQQRRGLGTRLLRGVQAAGREASIGQLSCRVERLDEPAAEFLLARDFVVEHEECLLESADLGSLPPVPSGRPDELRVYAAERAVGEFCRVYEAAFGDMAWSQPYSEAEVAAMLARPEDLLFLEIDGAPVGVVWSELLPDGRGRVEPLGIVPAARGQGHGRRLLLAALHDLRERGARPVEIGLWRQNTVALNLYKSLGFLEVDHWYYLACDLDGLKAE